MSILWGILGLLLVMATLWDAFTTIVIPKTVEHRISFSGIYYNATWAIWFRIARRLPDGNLRLAMLSAFAPITLLFLFLLWGALLISGFALVHFGHGSLEGVHSISEYLYFSGETFFTLGFGDLTSHHPFGQFLSVVEAGTGFGFLALVIGYIPVLYGHFSAREHQITLLDSRAGSDPTCGELLRRHAVGDAMEDLVSLLKEWETWSAKQLEAYLSYPILAFYRSQHDHQSWLCSLTAILDTCSLIEAGFEGDNPWEKRLQFQARATFAMGRHVIVDLAYLLNAEPDFKSPSRLPETTLEEIRRVLGEAGIPLCRDRIGIFHERRAMYEPYCISLARDLFLTLPSWLAESDALDNWEFSAWEKEPHF